jgi:hypothetical protein
MSITVMTMMGSMTYRDELLRLSLYVMEPDDLQKIEIAKQASPVAWYNINLKGT